MTAIENPTAQLGYKPVQMPMPEAGGRLLLPNSLWRNGSRAFFKDQRCAGRRSAHRDREFHRLQAGRSPTKASAQPSRKEIRGLTTSSALRRWAHRLRKCCLGRILTTDSSSSYDGKGSVNCQENLQTNVAVVVTQVLPNGNLVVEGKQEIRVNYEIRELIVAVSCGRGHPERQHHRSSKIAQVLHRFWAAAAARFDFQQLR